MLVALLHFNKEELLASLLLFRLLYYVIPFALALTILGGREIIKGLVTTRVPPLATITADVLVEPKEKNPSVSSGGQAPSRSDGRAQ